MDAVRRDMRIPLIAGIISVAYTDAIAREHRVACYAHFIANSKIRDCIGITEKAALETLLDPRAGALPRAVPEAAANQKIRLGRFADTGTRHGDGSTVSLRAMRQ